MKPKVMCTEEENRTKQSMKDQVDVNKIMAKYHKTGLLPVRAQGARFGDFSEITDYQSALQKVAEMNDLFAQLPAKARDRFDNNVGAFLAFVDDPANKDELVKMGLLASDFKPPEGAKPAAPGATVNVVQQNGEPTDIQ